MKREFCARLIQAVIDPDSVVLGAMGSSGRTWREIGAPHPTYYVLDPMGMSLPMAIGMALAMPKRSVVLLGGDGDFCTGMSALLAAVDAGVSNLRVAIFNSDRYESGGAQPLPAAGKFDLAGFGRAAGFGFAEQAASEEDATRLTTLWAKHQGPALLVFKVEVQASPYLPERPWAKVEDRAIFMRQLHGEKGPDYERALRP